MSIKNTKKPFKLNVLGLFKWESENFTVKEVAFILLIVMAFVIAIILILKLYILPALGGTGILKIIRSTFAKYFKTRAP